MAVLAIPNPKKSTLVDFPIERVKLSVLNISLINNKYKFTSSNEIFNQYTYEALEFLSLGVYLDINLNKMSDDKTEITVEVRRKIGTFNQSHEVTKANEHLIKIFDCIAQLTAKNPEEIENIKSEQLLNKSTDKKATKLSNENTTSPLNSSAWYEKNWLVVISCVVFFPVGLYALWKNSSISKSWKIGVTVLITLIVISNLGNDKQTTSTSLESQKIANTEQSNGEKLVNDKQEKVNSEKEAILEKLKSKAKSDWPNDYTTQEFWVNQQIEDYEYMLNIEDNSVKLKAQKDWPLDFSTQKYWYNEQIEAQERMK
jgi:hypothetical protein